MSGDTAREDRLDRELMQRVRRDDAAAFEQLYARYARPLMSFFYRMCYDTIASEDFLQETFLRVWRARRTYRPVGRVSTWLFQIAKNYWINERAKTKLRPFHEKTALFGSRDEAATELREPGAGTSPAAAAQAGETEAAIRAAVAELSEKLRLVFVLCRYQGMAYTHAAQVLGIPLGTVKSRMAAAEKTLRDKLRPLLGDQP